jgi:DNA mismatch repair protein MutS2
VDPRSLDLLELPAVRRRLAGHAFFDGGRALALEISPSPDADEVAARQAETGEALWLARIGVSGPGGAFDVRPAVREAERGAVLDIEVLDEVLATAMVVLETHATLISHDEDAPLLAERVRGVETGPLNGILVAFEAALDRRGGLLDTASPELARLRREVVRARENAAAQTRELAARVRTHLQESFITERGGRPVLAVKASSRSAVPGLVHDSSGSGQTLFVEPFALVEHNNRAREMEIAERQECERILGALSRTAGDAAPVLDGAVAALAAIDLAFARAALSIEWEGCEVEVGEEVLLDGARHPLLDPRSAVPVDLPLGTLRAVVVSGPNTGGKTVTLKTLGLFALLHQCGLRPPARRARLPVFDQVLADIGDDQSIAMSLSTFSGHVRNLIAIMEEAGTRSLVLLDEVAGGTDPAEGAALAQAVLERLVDKGARVLATSHLAELRDWAGATPEAANAAVGFDAATLASTYEFRLGEPGASHALAVAERLGLPADVLARARGHLAPERRAVEDLLLEADAARAAARAERSRVEEERARMEDARAAAERRERDLEKRIATMKERADDERAKARRAAADELAALTADLQALRAEIRTARAADAAGAREGAVGESARERDRRLGAADRMIAQARGSLAGLDAPAAQPEFTRPVQVGDRVTDRVLGMHGTVLAIEGSQADIQGPLARIRIPLDRLVPGRGPVPSSKREESDRVDVTLPQEASSPEIDLRGRRAEEVRYAVRERIDAASMAGLARLRVIHGHGTGALRSVVREELTRHPLVARMEPAPPGEGGDGATIAHLRDEESP